LVDRHRGTFRHVRAWACAQVTGDYPGHLVIGVGDPPGLQPRVKPRVPTPGIR